MCEGILSVFRPSFFVQQRILVEHKNYTATEAIAIFLMTSVVIDAGCTVAACAPQNPQMKTIFQYLADAAL